MKARAWAGIVMLGVCGPWLLLTAPGAHVDGVVDVPGGVREGVRVGLRGDSVRVCTDRVGRFVLPQSAPTGTLVAAKVGYRIASAPVGQRRLRLEPLPADDNDDYVWIEPRADPRRPQQCGNCHAAIEREWSASAHADSARNPRFLELFAGGPTSAPTWNVREEYPQGAGVCASCHAPTLRSPTLEYDVREAVGVAARGVHCDFCHKVADVPGDRLGTRFGRDGMMLLRPANGEQLFFGPLDDAVRPGESFSFAPIYRDSVYCASCHEGVVFGVQAYGTYSEWRDSGAGRRGQHCQQCHMRPTGTLTNVAPGQGGIERDPWTLASHAMPGATLAMLRGCLDVDVATHTAAAGVHVEIDLKTHDVGHRVPTGFADRQLLLIVEAFDAVDKAVVLVQGERLGTAAGRREAGRAGRLFAKRFVGVDGQPRPFWKAHEDVVDNRLWPDRVERTTFVFGSEATRLRVRLLYRRLWAAVAESRDGEVDELVVFERNVALR